jgi:hypothetical protein
MATSPRTPPLEQIRINLVHNERSGGLSSSNKAALPRQLSSHAATAAGRSLASPPNDRRRPSVRVLV